MLSEESFNKFVKDIITDLDIIVESDYDLYAKKQTINFKIPLSGKNLFLKRDLNNYLDKENKFNTLKVLDNCSINDKIYTSYMLII